MLVDIFEDAASTEADIEMVQILGREVDANRVRQEVGRFEADVVILGLGPVESVEAYRDLLSARPGVKVLGVAPDGREIDLYELSPKVTRVGNVAPRELMHVIRTPVR